jgi:hypothetical protein
VRMSATWDALASSQQVYLPSSTLSLVLQMRFKVCFTVTSMMFDLSRSQNRDPVLFIHM